MPEDTKDSSSIQADIQHLNSSTQNILSYRPKSRAYYDFNRVHGARKISEQRASGQPVSEELVKDYFTKAFNPAFIGDLSGNQFHRLTNEYGDTIYKISIVDQNLHRWLKNASEDEHILATGGVCAMESVDVRNIRALRMLPDGENLVKEYVKQAYTVFPSWTHVTGAIASTKGVNVLYDETFPWHLKIAEYGLENAEEKTQAVYKKYNTAVERFVQLVNKESILLRIPFTSLELDMSGELNKWFNEYHSYIRALETKYGIEALEYNADDFVRSWVLYTYMGPRILEILKNTIKNMYPSIYKENNLDNYTIHVRGKQFDHLTAERYSTWQHALLLEQEHSQDKKVLQLLNSKFHRYELGAYSWARDHIPAISSIGFAGFLDMNTYGHLHHETPLEKPVLQNVEDIKAYFLSPLRLHSKNVDIVIDFLRLFRRPTSIKFPKQLLESLTVTKHTLEKYDKKISSLRKQVNGFFILQKITGSLNKTTSGEHVVEMQINKKEFHDAKDVLTSVYAFMNTYQKYSAINTVLAEHTDSFNDLREITSFTVFQSLFKDISLTSLQKGKIVLQIVLDARIHLFKEVFSDIITELDDAVSADCDEMNQIIDEKGKLQKVYQNQLEHVSDEIIDTWEHPMRKHVVILPLCDNVFFSYMQQLLFVPSIRKAYIAIHDIAENRDYDMYKKEELICVVMHEIFPVLTNCIEYVFRAKKTYPDYERYEFPY